MKRFTRAVVVLIGIAALGFAIDYVNVLRKERRLARAVSNCGGRMWSIHFWPVGSEYRIALDSVPDDAHLASLAIANQMRGWVVVVVLGDAEIARRDVERLRAALPGCRAYVQEDERLVPVSGTSRDVNEPAGGERPRRRSGGA